MRWRRKLACGFAIGLLAIMAALLWPRSDRKVSAGFVLADYARSSTSLIARLAFTNGGAWVRHESFATAFGPHGKIQALTPAGWTNYEFQSFASCDVMVEPRAKVFLQVHLPLDALQWRFEDQVAQPNFRERFTGRLLSSGAWAEFHPFENATVAG